MQTAVYYRICSMHFTSSGVLVSAHATPCCKQPQDQVQPPPLMSPRRQGGPGLWESSLGETRSRHRLQRSQATGQREMAQGSSQPPCSPNSPSKCFFPQISPAQGPALCPEQVRLLAGAVQEHSSLGWGTGPIPTASGLGWGSCPCNISLGCSNPQYFGTEAHSLQAVYQQEQEYPQVAMATWASPWEPEGRQSCKHPAGHKQGLPSPCPPAAADGAPPQGTCAGTPRPGVRRALCIPTQRTPAPGLASPMLRRERLCP